MKYLKGYKLFESKSRNDIISDLKDICLDLSDNGFVIEIGSDCLFIYKGKYSGGGYKELDINEINDTLIRIKEYLGDRWISNKLFDEDDANGFIKTINGKSPLVMVQVLFKLPNVNESVLPKEDMFQDLTDICLDLNDIGYSIDIQDYGKKYSLYPQGYFHSYSVMISNVDMPFRLTNVKEYLIRIVEYLKDNSIESTVRIYNGRWFEIDPYHQNVETNTNGMDIIGAKVEFKL